MRLESNRFFELDLYIHGYFLSTSEVNPLTCHPIFDEICYFWACVSVDIRPLPGAWVADLLGVVLGVQDHKKIKFILVKIAHRGIIIAKIKKLNHGNSIFFYLFFFFFFFFAII